MSVLLRSFADPSALERELQREISVVAAGGEGGGRAELEDKLFRPNVAKAVTELSNETCCPFWTSATKRAAHFGLA